MKANTWTWIAAVLILLIGMVAGWQLTKAFTPKCPEIKRDTVKIPFDTVDFIAHLKPVIIQNYRDTGSIKWKDNIILLPSNYKPLTKKDSLSILKDYFATNFDTATIVNDSLLWFKLRYEITQNKLISGTGKYYLKKPQIIVNNNPIQPLKNQLYVGINLSGSADGFGAGSRITLKSKNDQLYHIGIDYMPYLTKKPIFSIGTDFKIKL